MPEEFWSFAQNIGVVANKAGKNCLEIRNAALQANSQIRLVRLAQPPLTGAAYVGSKDPSCASSDPANSGLQAYEVRLDGGSLAGQMPVIGVVNYRGELGKNGDLVSADLDGDGQPEAFRSCTSTEGIHFTVWTGKPLNGKLRWHQYYYLGYDVEPTCTNAELDSR